MQRSATLHTYHKRDFLNRVSSTLSNLSSNLSTFSQDKRPQAATAATATHFCVTPGILVDFFRRGNGRNYDFRYHHGHRSALAYKRQLSLLKLPLEPLPTNYRENVSRVLLWQVCLYALVPYPKCHQDSTARQISRSLSPGSNCGQSFLSWRRTFISEAHPCVSTSI